VLALVAPSVCGAVDIKAFDALSHRHTAGVHLRAFCAIYVFVFQMILGRERGKRAARRALYELCWRFSGRNTYSASGWTGRLFYKEC